MIQTQKQILIWCFSALFALSIGQTTYAQSCDNPTILCGDEAESVNDFSDVVFSGSPVDFCFEGDIWTVARFHTTYRITNNPVLVTIDNIDCIGGSVKAMVVQPDFSDFCDIGQYEIRSDCVTLNTNDTTQFYTHNDLYANTDYLVLVNYDSGSITGPCELEILVSGDPVSIDIFPGGWNYDEYPPDNFQVDYGYEIDLNVQGGDNGLNYSWDPGDQITGPTSGGSVLATPIQTTTYTVSGFVQSCNYTSQITYTVGYLINVPNSFSPNGDGNNDTWDVTGINNYPGSIINLYDRWGQQVLRKTGDYSWDGTNEKTGQPSPIGTYYYVINLNHMSITPEPLTGYITLVR